MKLICQKCFRPFLASFLDNYSKKVSVFLFVKVPRTVLFGGAPRIVLSYLHYFVFKRRAPGRAAQLLQTMENSFSCLSVHSAPPKVSQLQHKPAYNCPMLSSWDKDWVTPQYSVTRLCRFRLFMSFEGSKCRRILAYVGCRFCVVFDISMAFLCRFWDFPILL